ncbi:hypothetical protein HNQ36_005047 [Afipia massiliensis]|uniref:Uncharacterized protein n=1 Tax=Afipia massiliensis TaxID=211460 RepID=A0A840NEC1_9BRAD|nr:hypothetical protein [Afipia massiliensis]
MYARWLLVGSLLISVGSAWAHDAKGKHGGRVTDAGSYHVEMVLKSDTVGVFISDASEKPVTISGFKGTAILVVDGKSQRIVLAPVDGTRLSGSATAALPNQLKGVVQLTGPDGKTIQAKFD